MVLRDRNHPSIFAWSVGNETPQRADALELTKQLVAQVKKNDSTRPVTEAICDFWDHKGRQWPETDAAYALLDIGGYNYMLHKEAEDHQRAPGRIMACTESYPRATFEMWSLVQRRPYIIGDFVWTALDYLGEAGIGRVNIAGEGNNDHGKDTIFPIHGGSCGDLDINLFPSRSRTTATSSGGEGRSSTSPS
jgi:beta-galactosidase